MALRCLVTLAKWDAYACHGEHVEAVRAEVENVPTSVKQLQKLSLFDIANQTNLLTPATAAQFTPHKTKKVRRYDTVRTNAIPEMEYTTGNENARERMTGGRVIAWRRAPST